ncbi:MAG: hypothetical protein ACXAB4_10385 [Candidatus Hodarchaeales archaeon]|jgi:hypothetical protein
MSGEPGETLTAYQGLVCTAVMDTGPEVLFNLSETEDHIAQLLAIQALTMVSMGSGSKGLHGPIPVPHTPDRQALVYTFFAPAPDSEDERVRRSGRQYALFLLFSKGVHYTDQITAYTAEFIRDQTEGQLVTEETVSSLNERLQASVIFTVDTTELLQNQVASLSKRIQELETVLGQIKEVVNEAVPEGDDLLEKIRKLVGAARNQ